MYSRCLCPLYMRAEFFFSPLYFLFYFLCLIFFNWSILDWQCCASLCHCKVTLLSTHVHSFSYTLSHYGLSQLLNVVSVLYIRTLLSTHPKCNSFHLLNPNSQSIRFPLPLSNHEAVLCLWICSCFRDPCRILDFTYKWYHMVFVSLLLTYLTWYDNV